jgi:biopolymer transport protein ExbD
MPDIKIGQQVVQWSAASGRLTQLLQNQREKTVQLQARGLLPFGDVVRVIDICSGQGAKIFLAAPEL